MDPSRISLIFSFSRISLAISRGKRDTLRYVTRIRGYVTFDRGTLKSNTSEITLVTISGYLLSGHCPTLSLAAHTGRIWLGTGANKKPPVCKGVPAKRKNARGSQKNVGISMGTRLFVKTRYG
eukprot:1353841-Amorphochlora_amoeboformis.AAC.3